MALRAYQSAHPDQSLILQAARAHDLCPFLLHALLDAESRLSPRLVSKNGCAGIAQLSPGGRAAVGRLRGRRFTREHALDPREAVPAAALFLAHLVSRCGDMETGLRAWNTGRCGRPNGFVWHVLRKAARLRVEAGLPPPERPRPKRKEV